MSPRPARKPDDLVARTICLSRAVPPVLAVGAFLKNTVSVARGTEALVSRDLGNLDTLDAILAFEAAVADLIDSLGRAPVAVAHDLHPDFYGTRYARGLGIETVPVQHHHAHVAAVMAEHGVEGPILGLALDGFGLGPNDESWGGELLRVDAGGFTRLGHLATLVQPGGDAAARQPWRMGAAALHALGRSAEIATRFDGIAGAGVVAQMLERGVNCPPTSSCGRLFDAACGLLGVVPVATHEGQAPMALEAMVTQPHIQPASWRIADGVLDLLPLLDALSECEPGEGADLFHGTLTAALTDWTLWAAEETGLREVALCGGCLLNAVLREGLAAALEMRGLRPLLPRDLSPGDGAISLGQAWAAGLLKANDEG